MVTLYFHLFLKKQTVIIFLRKNIKINEIY